MHDQPDYDLHAMSEAPPPAPQRRAREGWVLAALALIAIGIGAYLVVRRAERPAPAEAPRAGGDTVLPAAPRALGGDAQPGTLPPLEQTDPTVRMLVRTITAHPTIAAWLATDGLIRQFTAAVANVADGRSPAKQLGIVRPAGAFRVVERAGALYVDPRSYQRYDRITDALASGDAAAWARVYATLKPRIEDAYRELGRGPGSFDRTFEQAVVQLLDTPSLDAPVRPSETGIGYEFVDPRLEGLTGAQRQLMRMGPKNVRRVRAALRAIGVALGMAPGDLPAG